MTQQVKGFSFERLEVLAKNCAMTIKENDGKVSVKELLEVVREICKIFDALGTMYNFLIPTLSKKYSLYSLSRKNVWVCSRKDVFSKLLLSNLISVLSEDISDIYKVSKFDPIFLERIL